MTNSEKLILNSRVDKEISVLCRNCVGKTSHKILANANMVGGNDFIDWSTDYQIVQCMGCKATSFRSESTNSEDFDIETDRFGEDIQTWAVVEKLYPPRLNGYSGLGQDIWLLPETLRRIYTETSAALVADQPVLTGIGVRAILEILCKDKQANGSNLFKQIDSLVTLGILTPVRASVLHQIRTLGNLSAHEAAPHSIEQLSLAMTVVDHLLEEVYILPEKTQIHFSALAAPSSAVNPSPPVVTLTPPTALPQAQLPINSL